MNNIFKKLVTLTLVVFAISAFAGCDNSDSSSQVETTVASTTVAPTTTASNTADLSSDITTDIKALHYYDSENGDILAGAWKITEGQGSQYENFVYVFDGNGKITLYVDNMGYLENYTLDESAKTLQVNLMFGLNGTYSYKLSDDKKSFEFTSKENNSTTVMEKLDDFDMIPKAEEKPQIDDKILGAWLSENGEYIYFDADGIMYDNLFNKTVTYSNYSAVDGVITSKYTMQNEELTDNYNYSVNGNVLTLNDIAYNKIPASELV